jgi:uncharacterized protein with ATP-grasp and redox domains
MHALFECLPCIARQALDIARMHDLPAQKKLALLRAVLRILGTADPSRTSPPELTKKVHLVLKKLLGKKDLYAAAKKRENRLALKFLPWAEREIDRAKDRLYAAVKLAIAGNIIDYGTASYFSLEDELAKLEHKKFAIDDHLRFKKALGRPGQKILYIGDNAGEIAFDTLLVRELLRLGHQVVFAVKSDFALNDATLADAKACGMNKLVPVIKSGSTTAGTLLKEASAEFRGYFDRADVIIAKGQGNFETLPLDDPRIFFLLKMKCVYLGKMVKVKLGDIMLVQGNSRLRNSLK